MGEPESTRCRQARRASPSADPVPPGALDAFVPPTPTRYARCGAGAVSRTACRRACGPASGWPWPLDGVRRRGQDRARPTSSQRRSGSSRAAATSCGSRSTASTGLACGARGPRPQGPRPSTEDSVRLRRLPSTSASRSRSGRGEPVHPRRQRRRGRRCRWSSGAGRPSGPDAVLLIDGIFLQRTGARRGLGRDGLRSRCPSRCSVPAGQRPLRRSATTPTPEAATNRRYVGGQRLYLAAADPRARATWVIDNTDLEAPRLL